MKTFKTILVCLTILCVLAAGLFLTNKYTDFGFVRQTVWQRYAVGENGKRRNGDSQYFRIHVSLLLWRPCAGREEK